ncbi:D-2-hydroxyacid dehydrogenase family protein [Fredinandcohnia onubensis]|uniref:D-2-hydroxyacid dehydrogenase family protein n=1 Tax=Fredinandcohnia onubensis TaxID=1571209 RepID=UPI000C0BBF9D|nr:D-2-hydroxyacid dehydrogenase family protein [Fredinandcohnia onubensis]
MSLKCVILDDYQNIALQMADWSLLSNEVEISSINEHIDNEDELVKAIKNYEIIVIMRERTPFPASLLNRLPNLKLLITSGMRNASIDLKTATKLGITVCGTASSSEPPTELTWALILGLARNIKKECQSLTSNGPWQSTVGTDLYGKRLGLIGLGKIGSRMARIGKAFGMKVMAWSQNLTQERTEELGVEKAESLEELLKASDFVSIHLVLSDRTRDLIGENEIKLMKPSAFLINTSRSAIINQKNLITALENNWIAGAGLDVYEEEPLPENHLFRELPNVLALPHLGYVTRNNYETYFSEAVGDIEAFIKGEPKRVLNP